MGFFVAYVRYTTPEHAHHTEAPPPPPLPPFAPVFGRNKRISMMLTSLCFARVAGRRRVAIALTISVISN